MNSINEDTATIGFLIDKQVLFQDYRAKMQTLNSNVETAKVVINERLSTLQKQFTEEKFNDAMNRVTTAINGTWDAETGQLVADVPNEARLTELRQQIELTYDQELNSAMATLRNETDSKLVNTKNEISATVAKVDEKITGLTIGGRNLIRNSEKVTDYIILDSVEKAGTYSLSFEPHFTEEIPDKFGVFYGGSIDVLANDKPRITHTFEVSEDRIGKEIRLFFGGTYMTHKKFANNGYVGKVKLEYGDFATDWTPAPEDIERAISNSEKEAEEAAKAYADAQDALRKTEAQAYADGIVTAEEERAINDAKAKLQEAKTYAEQQKQIAIDTANDNTTSALEPITVRTTNNENSIKTLEDKILLTATKEDVAQQLDSELTPIRTDVNDQKAQLSVMSDEISSKVSMNQYSLDQKNIVEQLNNAETERKQLSDEITDKVTQVEFNTKAYADGIKQQTDQTLTTYDTRITQNGQEISQRATKEEFNASRKTLSQVISELTNSTMNGLTYTYDENGAIQSFNVGPDGTSINTSKLTIDAGDVSLRDGVFTVKSVNTNNVTIPRTDGGVPTIINGIDKRESAITGTTPPFKQKLSGNVPVFYESGYWLGCLKRTTDQEYLSYDAFYFTHDRRYLSVSVIFLVGQKATTDPNERTVGEFIKLEEFSPPPSIESQYLINEFKGFATTAPEQDGGGRVQYTFIKDLGPPTGLPRQFYFKVKPNAEGVANPLFDTSKPYSMAKFQIRKTILYG
ncbi:hypothetical protein RCF73_05025 [Staphylococcus chromogenes]|uniref:hypothetical protein n=1 Tax=Staphylococcus chromogenes TaxID=46126 RepID=UPI003AFFB557